MSDAASIAVTTWLDGLGAGEVAHPGGTLLRHLRGAHDELAVLGAPSHHRLAALCHAVYGTDGLDRSLVAADDRDTVRTMIGVEAEQLVHLYSLTDQDHFTRVASPTDRSLRHRHTSEIVALTEAELTGLIAVWLGNELDLLAHADSSWALAGGPDVWAMLERNASIAGENELAVLRERINDVRRGAGHV